MDNRFIERLWRSVKHEDIYLQDYRDGIGAGRGLARWFENYNQLRPHQALHYATPAEVYFDPGAHGAQPAPWEAMQPQGSRRGKRLEIRPPLAAKLGTLRKGEGGRAVPRMARSLFSKGF